MRVLLVLFILFVSIRGGRRSKWSTGSGGSGSGDDEPCLPIVFIHGGGLNGQIWDQVISYLKCGTKIALTLSGHGNDTIPPGQVTLQNYVEQIVEVVSQFNGKVMLVGHETGSLFIAQVAEIIPDKIRVIVNVAGIIPQDGDSYFSLLQKFVQLFGDFEAIHRVEILPDYVRINQSDIFFNDCLFGPDTTKWINYLNNAREPIRPLQTPIHITPINYGRIPKVYITTGRDLVLPPEHQEKFIMDNPMDHVIPFEKSGHLPMICKPKALAQRLWYIREFYTPRTNNNDVDSDNDSDYHH